MGLFYTSENERQKQITNEEAIEIINHIAKINSVYGECMEEFNKNLNGLVKAIQALEQPQIVYCKNCIHDLKSTCMMISKGDEGVPRREDFCSYGERGI